MVKSRFSSLDVRAMVNSIRPSVVHCKLTNIYDINSRVYLLKFSRKNFKCFLLLESGTRFHLTDYTRDKSSVPSNYTMKLRKHLRTRRLTSIEQLGCDRTIDLTFGRGENSFHLILELYVSGNLILADHEYRILSLLRGSGSGENKVAPRQVYPREQAKGLLAAPPEEFADIVDEVLEKARSRQENQEIHELETEDAKAMQAANKVQSAFAKRSKKRVQHDAMPLVVLLQKLAPFADPALAALCVQRAMEANDRPCPKPFQVTVDDLPFDEVVSTLQAAAQQLLDMLRSVSRPGDLGGGSMAELAAPADGEDAEDAEDVDEDEGDGDAAKTAEAGEKGEVDKPPDCVGPTIPGWIVRKRVHVPPVEPHWANDEFTPLRPSAARESEPEGCVHFATFHQCVDEFFTQLEEHRAVEQKAQHAQSVYAKVEKIRVDQGRRVELLEGEQAAAERQASLIEANVELVTRALDMLNTMLASQVDWGELWREVKRQQRLGHPIAEHIHSLDLQRNEVKLLLSAQSEDNKDGEDEGEEDESEDDRPMDVVPLDLNLSAHANVARLHSRRKETRDKTSRTLTQAESAVKQAEKKAEKDLKKFELKQTIRRVRQTWWFEKFIWFISSENYLVLAAHDSKQQEHLFCKYLGAQDIFVHADVAGAKPCFIKNPSGGEVPPATLCEAGTTALCHSSAWDKHIVISPWWVFMSAVSRGAPPAEGGFVVVDGGFFVRGHRRFTPHLHLEMGITLLFHVGESSRARHKGERRSRYLEALGRAGGAAQTPDSGEGAEGVEGEVVDEGKIESSPDTASQPPLQDEEHEESQPDLVAKPGSAVDPAPDPAAKPATTRDEDEEEEEDDEDDNEGEEAAAAEPAEPAEAEAAAEAGASSEPAALDEAQAEAEAAAGASSEPATLDEASGRTTRARMSKAERRKLQKGGVGGSEAAAPAEAVSAVAPEQPLPGPAAKAEKVAPKAKAAAAPAAPTKMPRGQQAKLKKIREKYGDQDDEERELRLAVLGSKATKQLSAAAAPGAGGQQPQQAPQQLAPAEEPAPVREAIESAGPTAGGGKPAGKGKARGKGGAGQLDSAAEVQTAGCDADSDAAALLGQLAQLDLLTGQPGAEDEVLYILPMVAPYSALSGPYAHRVKLTPGNVKKGQVARQCLKIFEGQVPKPAWRQLVQAVPENEAASMLCGSCKLSMPGLQKLQEKLKQDKKRETRAQQRAE